MHPAEFVDIVWSYYAKLRRDLPWRRADPDGSYDPYKILVSEIMLQQTQVNRVIPKYTAFLELFPSVQQLAAAPLGEVLRAWSGLGYNRRAKFLWQAATMVVTDFNGQFPTTQKDLVALPGVGTNTAGAMCAYAYNQPVIFVETNIRSVFIHEFFADDDHVHDRQIVPLLEACLECLGSDEYRDWYWALMDYGTYLKANHGNATRRSAHYAKQSPFAGSRRQIRGRVLKILGEGPVDVSTLRSEISDERLPEVLDDLCNEQLIRRSGSAYRLT